MPKFEVILYDYVRIDYAVIVEADDEHAARAEAIRQVDEDGVDGENSWESYGETRVDSIKKLEDDNE